MPDVVDALVGEIGRLLGWEPDRPRELYLHRSDFEQVMMDAPLQRGGAFSFEDHIRTQPFNPRRLAQSDFDPLAFRALTERVPTFGGIVLRMSPFVMRGTVIALYEHRTPALGIYRFYKTPENDPPRVLAVRKARKTLFERLRESPQSFSLPTPQR